MSDPVYVVYTMGLKGYGLGAGMGSYLELLFIVRG